MIQEKKIKNAVVTGGSSGIGKAFAQHLAVEGYRIYVFSRDSSHFRELMETWRHDNRFIPITGDITNPEDVEKLMDTIQQQDNHLDLLVNNAGILHPKDGPLPDMETLQQTIEINLTGQYRIINSCIPLLEQAEKPVIINISSGSGSMLMVSKSGPLAYRTSKAGLNMLTKSLSFELSRKNIAIHSVDPGFVNTKLSPGGISPETAVENMWHLVTLHDLQKSGQYWYQKETVAC